MSNGSKRNLYDFIYKEIYTILYMTYSFLAYNKNE